MAHIVYDTGVPAFMYGGVYVCIHVTVAYNWVYFHRLVYEWVMEESLEYSLPHSGHIWVYVMAYSCVYSLVYMYGIRMIKIRICMRLHSCIGLYDGIHG